MSLSRVQRSWMVTQCQIGEHIHCRQKHGKCGGLLRHCGQKAQQIILWHLYRLNRCPPDRFAARDSVRSIKATYWWPCEKKKKQKKYLPADGRPLRSHPLHWSLQTQLPANSGTADAKRPRDGHADADFSVSVWLALLLCLGPAFSYIILQRTEAQITGKANTDLWGMHTSLCTCSCCM